MTAKKLRVTRHAAETMASRGVTLDAVKAVIADPLVVEPHQGAKRYAGEGGLVAVVAEEHPDERVLITVLLRSTAQWDDRQARSRFT